MSKIILYNKIKEHINAVEGFKCFGLYNGQFDREIDEDVLTYPAVFVSFGSIEWANVLGSVKNLQEGLIEVELRVGFKRLDKDNEGTLSEIDKLFVALEAFGDDEFDPLRRVRDTQDTNYNNLEEWILTFRTILRDTQATMTGTQTHTITSLDARTDSTISTDV